MPPPPQKISHWLWAQYEKCVIVKEAVKKGRKKDTAHQTTTKSGGGKNQNPNLVNWASLRELPCSSSSLAPATTSTSTWSSSVLARSINAAVRSRCASSSSAADGVLTTPWRSSFVGTIRSSSSSSSRKLAGRAASGGGETAPRGGRGRGGEERAKKELILGVHIPGISCLIYILLVFETCLFMIDGIEWGGKGEERINIGNLYILIVVILFFIFRTCLFIIYIE